MVSLWPPLFSTHITALKGHLLTSRVYSRCRAGKSDASILTTATTATATQDIFIHLNAIQSHGSHFFHLEELPLKFLKLSSTGDYQ